MNPSSSGLSKSTNKSSRSLHGLTSHASSLGTSLASTANSAHDDQIWIQFLSSLNQPALSKNDRSDEGTSLAADGSTPLNGQDFAQNALLTNNPNEFNYNTSFINSSIDIDDAADDPDFTVSLDNCEFDDADYLDHLFQVPKKEAVELVKDAIEFCDGIPIVCDDHRNSRFKSYTITRKSSLLHGVNNEAKSAHHQEGPSNASNRSKDHHEAKESHDESTSSKNQAEKPNQARITSNDDEISSADSVDDSSQDGEYVPQFTDLERKKLDEQLRNHIQMLTQTCLATYCSVEYGHVFNDAHKLLKVWKTLKENRDNADSDRIRLSPNFDIVNLDEAIEITENIQKMNKNELTLSSRQEIPTKFLEIIVNSPVFYNTTLIPRLSRSNYSSYFKRHQFSDTEKILLIMGFNKFKHLPKSECCECIREHLMPNRSSEDIRKQLYSISNSEQRQNSLKELLKKQKQLSTLENYEFLKRVHYKSPLQQSHRTQLPSMYTIIIERFKMANMLKESKEMQQKAKRHQHHDNRSTSGDEGARSDDHDETLRTKTKKAKMTSNATCETTPSNLSESHIDLGHVEKRSDSAESSFSSVDASSSSFSYNLQDTTVIEKSTSSAAAKPNESIHNQSSTANIILSNVANTTAAPAYILPSTNFLQLFSHPANLMGGTRFNSPNLDCQMVGAPAVHQPAFSIPPNFAGTILFQPTIHIHCRPDTAAAFLTDKFRAIRPKQSAANAASATETDKTRKASKK